MKPNTLIVFAGVVAALLLAGCASPPHRVLSQKPSAYAALPNGYDPLNPGQVSPIYAELAAEEGNLVRQMERKKGRALNILSLSGGGQNGAFGAGLLTGWRETGQRPQFDVVGGVSTGALLATHALLGTPADDAQLEEMYTRITKKDIHNERGIFSLAFGADSLSDTAPLRALITKFITAETLKRVAAAYDADNRLLAVGTTNIDYGQTWVWNMSLIAKDGNLELYRQVLLASASFPIVFPPVEIDGHLFVDGAARSNVVIPGIAGSERPMPPLYGPGNIYLIDNGKLHSPPEALRRALGDVAATTISTMMDQSMLTAMNRVYFGAKVLGRIYLGDRVPVAVNMKTAKVLDIQDSAVDLSARRHGDRVRSRVSALEKLDCPFRSEADLLSTTHTNRQAANSCSWFGRLRSSSNSDNSDVVRPAGIKICLR